MFRTRHTLGVNTTMMTSFEGHGPLGDRAVTMPTPVGPMTRNVMTRQVTPHNPVTREVAPRPVVTRRVPARDWRRHWTVMAMVVVGTRSDRRGRADPVMMVNARFGVRGGED
jgi:hypothetical protein